MIFFPNNVQKGLLGYRKMVSIKESLKGWVGEQKFKGMVVYSCLKSSLLIIQVV